MGVQGKATRPVVIPVRAPATGGSSFVGHQRPNEEPLEKRIKSGRDGTSTRDEPSRESAIKEKEFTSPVQNPLANGNTLEKRLINNSSCDNGERKEEGREREGEKERKYATLVKQMGSYGQRAWPPDPLQLGRFLVSLIGP